MIAPLENAGQIKKSSIGTIFICIFAKKAVPLRRK
jgi:hypothetical protein